MKHISYLLTSLFLLSTACNKPDNTYIDEIGNTVCIQGIVYDQVTKQPVSDARVGLFCCNYWDYWKVRPMNNAEISTTTDSKGYYEILYQKQSENVPPEIAGFPNGFFVSAVKNGYIGSKRTSLDYIPLEQADIYLYHSALLHLYVKNDTIGNQIDTALIYMSRFGFNPFMYLDVTYEFEIPSEGRNYDSLIILPNLWANYKYYLDVYLGPMDILMDVNEYEFTLKPDIVTEMDISF